MQQNDTDHYCLDSLWTCAFKSSWYSGSLELLSGERHGRCCPSMLDLSHTVHPGEGSSEKSLAMDFLRRWRPSLGTWILAPLLQEPPLPASGKSPVSISTLKIIGVIMYCGRGIPKVRQRKRKLP